MPNLILLSGNTGKLREIQHLLADLPCNIQTYQHVTGNVFNVIEDGQTFSENAIKKVSTLPPQPNTYTLADDSGLCVDALNGRPGVLSARYGGVDSSYHDKCQRLLTELNGLSNRAAQFRCVIALQTPTGIIHTCEGIVHGHIAQSISGARGFGYDPIFIPDGKTKTFADMSPHEKNAISHRAIALEQLRDILVKQLIKP